MDLAAFIDRYDQAWNDQDVDTIMSMHTPDMVFENHNGRLPMRVRAVLACHGRIVGAPPRAAGVQRARVARHAAAGLTYPSGATQIRQPASRRSRRAAARKRSRLVSRRSGPNTSSPAFFSRTI